MRLIDGDALEKEGWSLHRDIQVDKNTWEYQTKPLRQVPTIETQRTGHWIEDDDEMFVICSECGEKNDYTSAYCPDCGTRMERY